MIILDTNQLERAQPPDGPLIAMLQTLGGQTGHQLCLPELVRVEHLAHYRREVEAALTKRQAAEDDLLKLVPNIRYQEQAPLDVDRAVVTRSERLEQVFVIRPTPDTAAREALLREARRMPPAKVSHDGPGSGARDVAIWLTAIAACKESAENTFFVAADNNAFGKETLKPELLEELLVQLGTDASLFRYCYGLDVLLSQIGAEHRSAPTFGSIVNDPLVQAAVASSLYDHDLLWQLVYGAGLMQAGVASLLPGTGLQAMHRTGERVVAYRVGDTTWACARPVWEAKKRLLLDPGNWTDRYAVELTFRMNTTVMMQMSDADEIASAEVTARSGISRIRGVTINRDIAQYGIELDAQPDSSHPESAVEPVIQHATDN